MRSSFNFFPVSIPLDILNKKVAQLPVNIGIMLLISSTQFLTPLSLKPYIFLSSSSDKTRRENNYGCSAAAGGGGCITKSSHQRRRWALRSSSNEGVAEAAPSLDSSTTVVRKFYEGINGRDLGSVENLISENCVYEDLIFPQPFVGRKAILDFFKKFIDSFSPDLQFVIEDISEDDVSGVGVTWHLDWKGKPFPFSKGCSFYRLEVVQGQKQIVYGRDSVEPAIKPGESALVSLVNEVESLSQLTT